MTLEEQIEDLKNQVEATASKNKELFLINGATHIETYWKPDYVLQAVNKLVDFYQINL